jgi:hypothetical protein
MKKELLNKNLYNMWGHKIKNSVIVITPSGHNGWVWSGDYEVICALANP